MICLRNAAFMTELRCRALELESRFRVIRAVMCVVAFELYGEWLILLLVKIAMPCRRRPLVLLLRLLN